MIALLIGFIGLLNIGVTYYFYFELKKIFLSDVHDTIKEVVKEVVKEELKRFFGD